MVAKLDGVVFDQVYGDNSGGAEFDSDGDGTATQEDEFVAFRNTSGSDVDISGWEVWSDSTGTGAPDPQQDGKYHTFPPGTVLKPGESLYVINEITGPEKGWMQEASEGGVESGAGGTNTNFLTEGSANASAGESIALVNPATGEYIVFNMAPSAEAVSGLSGFPGTTSVGEDDASSVQADQNAGSSYQYDPDTDSFIFQAVLVPCFTPGTLIATPGGEVAIEYLTVGDLVLTRDNGPQRLRSILRRCLDFEGGADAKHKPIEFKSGSLAVGLPKRTLVVSPQHRMLLRDQESAEVLAPAKALTHRKGVRVMKGRKQVEYIQLVFGRHEVVWAEGVLTESFYPGAYAMSACDRATRREIHQIFPELRYAQAPRPARRLLSVSEGRRLPVTARTA